VVDEARSGAYKEKRASEGDGKGYDWWARLEMRQLAIRMMEIAVTTDISHSRLLLASSVTRMISPCLRLRRLRLSAQRVYRFAAGKG
jgi:hypothetical protein